MASSKRFGDLGLDHVCIGARVGRGYSNHGRIHARILADSEIGESDHPKEDDRQGHDDSKNRAPDGNRGEAHALAYLRKVKGETGSDLENAGGDHSVKGGKPCGDLDLGLCSDPCFHALFAGGTAFDHIDLLPLEIRYECLGRNHQGIGDLFNDELDLGKSARNKMPMGIRSTGTE